MLEWVRELRSSVGTIFRSGTYFAPPEPAKDFLNATKLHWHKALQNELDQEKSLNSSKKRPSARNGDVYGSSWIPGSRVLFIALMRSLLTLAHLAK